MDVNIIQMVGFYGQIRGREVALPKGSEMEVGVSEEEESDLGSAEFPG